MNLENSVSDSMKPPTSCAENCTCRPSRRHIVQLAALGVATAMTAAFPAMAGPFETADFQKLVPADKKLSPEWLQSLFARGQRTVYRGADLRFIGMPVGGLCAGQLYLGGDGKLWHWDIFNEQQHTGSAHYAKPPPPRSPVDQGFSLKFIAAGKAIERTLDANSFKDVSFSGEYPFGFVEYRDEDCPIEISLEAFSPFIPLNVDDSSLPATALRFTLKNIGKEKIDIELTGWLQNAVCLNNGVKAGGVRKNRVGRDPKLLYLDCSATPIAPATALKPKAPPTTLPAFFDLPDYGTMALSLLEPGELDDGNAAVDSGAVERPMTEKLVGSVTRQATLEPGAAHVATFVISWRFPNLVIKNIQGGVGRHYATRFMSAVEVAKHIAENWPHLYGQTKLWHDTWYDSTLPYWFLDRTLLNASILATSTAHRFANGRFWGWEGVGCCEGTCTHVWQYEQAMGRLFPQLDVLLRERCDFAMGVGFHPDTGIIGHRGEHLGAAVDGQAGTILRAYRDHQTSADGAFLKRNWPNIRKAVEWLIQQDGNGDGILEGPQHNTLDTEWFGPVAWLSGLYLASLRAAEEMANDAGDADFAAHCRRIFDAGQKQFVATLFNGEYFINKPDPKRPDAINSGSGCEIDQVFGQSWAWQVALGRILPAEQTLSALRSLWRYNFTPDVGPYRQAHKPGRWYAMPGEAGLLMCTFPKADWDYEKAKGKGPQWAAGYFNECMNGFEYQVAGHMISEGMVREGLAVGRAIHDRYHASRRNPWNEVECGDHYARSMASYGLFTAACGFAYHGPKGYMAFAPRLTPDDFKAAFTAAEGWGTFAQKHEGTSLRASLVVNCGRLRLRELALDLPDGAAGDQAAVTIDGKAVEATVQLGGRRAKVRLEAEVVLTEGQQLTVKL